MTDTYRLMTVTIPLWQYRQLMDLATRANVLRDYMKENEYIAQKDARIIMGFRDGGCEDGDTVRIEG